MAVLALSLSGCVASNMTEMVKALASDPATACVVVTTPYGGAVVVRTNSSGQPSEISGVGGGCSVKNEAGTPAKP